MTTARLDALDQRLFALLAERAAEVARLRAADALDAFGHEAHVVRGAERHATSAALDPALTRAVALALARSDLAGLSMDPALRRVAPTAGRATVIGGAGRMGAWTARFLAALGYEVCVADPRGTLDGFAHAGDWRSAAEDADVLVVAAPLRPSNAILHELATAPPRGLVFDIGSLKSPLRSGLTALAAEGARVTSVHPMFGPDVELLTGRHVIFCDVGCPGATDAAEELFAGTSASRVRMSLEQHDRVIAYILGLSHALNIAFVTAIAESGEAAPRLAELSSTTFDAQLDVARRVVRENPRLYFEIQHLNDYGVESLAALSDAVEKVRAVVRAGDEDAFCRLMAQGSAYVEGRAR